MIKAAVDKGDKPNIFWSDWPYLHFDFDALDLFDNQVAEGDQFRRFVFHFPGNDTMASGNVWPTIRP